MALLEALSPPGTHEAPQINTTSNTNESSLSGSNVGGALGHGLWLCLAGHEISGRQSLSGVVTRSRGEGTGGVTRPLMVVAMPQCCSGTFPSLTLLISPHHLADLSVSLSTGSIHHAKRRAAFPASTFSSPGMSTPPVGLSHLRGAETSPKINTLPTCHRAVSTNQSHLSDRNVGG